MGTMCNQAFFSLASQWPMKWYRKDKIWTCKGSGSPRFMININIFGAYLAAPNMVKLCVPEKILQNAVQTRAVESLSREKSKNRKIGSDFLSNLLAKMPKCH